MRVKDTILDVKDTIPDEVPWSDEEYRQYVLAKIAKGLQDVEDGNLISQEEVEKTVEKWFE